MVGFCISALCALQMNSLKQWLSVPINRKQIPFDVFVVVSIELNSNSVAIEGWKIYPVLMFSLIANVNLLSHKFAQKNTLHEYAGIFRI